jgi:hypothetical protein
MLTIFHHAKAKSLCLASFLSKKKKRRLLGCKRLIFLKRKLTIQNLLFQDDEKSSASAQRQATHTGKISGHCNFCGGCNDKN